MLAALTNPLRSPDHVYWCSDLCSESPTFKMAITDLSASTIEQLVQETDSKAAFEDAVLDEWT